MSVEKSDKARPDHSRNKQISQSSLTVLDKDGKPVEFSKVIMEPGDASGSNSSIVTIVATIADLRNLEPDIPGQLAVVIEYNAGTKTGGGVFMYDSADKSTPDDFGVTIVTSRGARWKRNVNNPRDLTVLEFGAINGGSIDTAEAVMHMWNWSEKNNPSIGIQFPAGKFLLSRFDIADKEVTRFRVVGDSVSFGYSPATTLISDKKDSEVMFSVNARYTEISSLIVDGESTADARNTKGFYKNIIEAGQYVRISEMMFYNLGVRALACWIRWTVKLISGMPATAPTALSMPPGQIIPMASGITLPLLSYLTLIFSTVLRSPPLIYSAQRNL